ncbi:hypothetical protein CPB84DRAFT_1749056 [Gymnopilus junonius]|uniref:Uncharacterized protein n=1 Tax=Gymnopilus junonius TaxID=109634 RepID=A0A9P5NJH5_GYMJU|nr:hypothetical protein CPB84DRAFT_1749056 [Gymnopilus junonius]
MASGRLKDTSIIRLQRYAVFATITGRRSYFPTLTLQTLTSTNPCLLHTCFGEWDRRDSPELLHPGHYFVFWDDSNGAPAPAWPELRPVPKPIKVARKCQTKESVLASRNDSEVISLKEREHTVAATPFSPFERSHQFKYDVRERDQMLRIFAHLAELSQVANPAATPLRCVNVNPHFAVHATTHDISITKSGFWWFCDHSTGYPRKEKEKKEEKREEFINLNYGTV